MAIHTYNIHTRTLQVNSINQLLVLVSCINFHYEFSTAKIIESRNRNRRKSK